MFGQYFKCRNICHDKTYILFIIVTKSKEWDFVTKLLWPTEYCEKKMYVLVTEKNF